MDILTQILLFNFPKPPFAASSALVHTLAWTVQIARISDGTPMSVDYGNCTQRYEVAGATDATNELGEKPAIGSHKAQSVRPALGDRAVRIWTAQAIHGSSLGSSPRVWHRPQPTRYR